MVDWLLHLDEVNVILDLRIGRHFLNKILKHNLLFFLMSKDALLIKVESPKIDVPLL